MFGIPRGMFDVTGVLTCAASAHLTWSGCGAPPPRSTPTNQGDALSVAIQSPLTHKPTGPDARICRDGETYLAKTQYAQGRRIKDS